MEINGNKLPQKTNFRKYVAEIFGSDYALSLASLKLRSV
jgi:hypothetical protein